MNKKTFIFDIDNTICFTPKNYYSKSKPKKSVIDLINSLKKNGHTIKIFTSRYMGRNNDNYIKVKKNYYEKIKKQLKKWNVNYDKLIVGKPSYDFFIDDKCFNIKDKKTFAILNKFRINENNKK